MKYASLLAAASIVVIADTLALVHASRNRSGPVEAEITLTEKELLPAYNSESEDSGVSLRLTWVDGSWLFWRTGQHWLNKEILQEIGFDTSVPAAARTAYEFYSRQRPRRAFVALEYDGPEWRKLMEVEERLAPENSNRQLNSSRLVVFDASSSAGRLRSRHPTESVIIVPAVIRILGWSSPQQGDQAGIPRLSGYIQDIPAKIHVPRPFSEALRPVPTTPPRKYRVRIRYGHALEPWIVGVEMLGPDGP